MGGRRIETTVARAAAVILTRSRRIPRREPPHLRGHPAPPFIATPTEAPCNADARRATYGGSFGQTAASG